jgi:hypothetical protein
VWIGPKRWLTRRRPTIDGTHSRRDRFTDRAPRIASRRRGVHSRFRLAQSHGEGRLCHGPLRTSSELTPQL